MKKLISVLLAVSALALSTSAFAAPAVSTISDRNPNTNALAEEQTGILPCFREEDSVTFDLTGLTGSQLTLISSKVGATADNSTIQYINQYTVSDGAAAVNYKIRKGLANGTYNILIKDGDATVVDYFYNVANPDVALLKHDANSTDYIVAKNADGDQSYAAVASVEGASFTESGVTGVGFRFEDSNDKSATSTTLSAVELDAIAGEVSGKINVYYGITIKGVTEGANIVPTAVMN